MTPADKLLPILQDCYRPREDGWLWVALYQAGEENGVLHEITGEHSDPAPMAQALAEVINGAGADCAFLALCRTGGQPREADREFWRRLNSLVENSRLVDLVVFNRTSTWSMRHDESAVA